jgi:hypothetical protein
MSCGTAGLAYRWNGRTVGIAYRCEPKRGRANLQVGVRPSRICVQIGAQCARCGYPDLVHAPSPYYEHALIFVSSLPWALSDIMLLPARRAALRKDAVMLLLLNNCALLQFMHSGCADLAHAALRYLLAMLRTLRMHL